MQSNFSIILGFIELINIYLSIKNLRAMECNSFKRACKTLAYAKRKILVMENGLKTMELIIRELF